MPFLSPRSPKALASSLDAVLDQESAIQKILGQGPKGRSKRRSRTETGKPAVLGESPGPLWEQEAVLVRAPSMRLPFA